MNVKEEFLTDWSLQQICDHLDYPIEALEAPHTPFRDEGLMLQRDILSNIFKHLSLVSLLHAKLVCKKWHVIENNRCKKLFLMCVIDGNKQCLCSPGYKNQMGLTPEQANVESLLTQKWQIGFFKSLFGISCFRVYAKEEKLSAIAAYFELYEKSCPAAQFALSFFCPREKAHVYIKAAADRGITNAQFCISKYYSKQEQGGELALEYLQAAKDQCMLSPQNLHQIALAYESIYFYMKKKHAKKKEMKQQTIAYFTAAADLGYAPSQYLIGLTSIRGTLFERNLANANRYLRLAAQQGHARAQYMLALIYINGLGVPRNYHEAYDFAEKAAKQGHMHSISRMCQFNALGIGCKRNSKAASAYFKQLLGLVESCNDLPLRVELGICYHRGFGVDRNKDAALAYFNSCAAENDKTSLLFLAEICEAKRNLRGALEFYIKAADQGVAQAQFKICQFANSGLEIEQGNLEKYFKLLSDPDHPEENLQCGERLANISYCYAHGIAIEENKIYARELYRMAATFGSTEAQFDLCKEAAAAKAHVEAAYYFNLLADPNHPEITKIAARYRMISHCLANGIGVAVDLEAATSYDQLAAELA